MLSGVNLISFPNCRQMRRHGSSGKRQREEDAEAEDDLQFVAAAAVEPEISEDTIPGTARESRVSRQPRIDPNTGEQVILADLCLDLNWVSLLGQHSHTVGRWCRNSKYTKCTWNTSF